MFDEGSHAFEVDGCCFLIFIMLYVHGNCYLAWFTVIDVMIYVRSWRLFLLVRTSLVGGHDYK